MKDVRVLNIYKSVFCFLQPRQREGKGQAEPEGLRGGPEVKDEGVAGPAVRS